MKKILLLSFIITAFLSNAQEQVDYKLARTGEYVLGVYLFVHCDPVAHYDYVGKVDKFDIYKTDTKAIEKIIKKAKKKNPDFDGMIIKRDFKHIELIKFKDRTTSYAGFELGESVQYVTFGHVVIGEIVDFVPHKGKVKVRHFDSEGNEKLDTVNIKILNKAPNQKNTEE